MSVAGDKGDRNNVTKTRVVMIAPLSSLATSDACIDERLATWYLSKLAIPNIVMPISGAVRDDKVGIIEKFGFQWSLWVCKALHDHKNRVFEMKPPWISFNLGMDK